MSKTMKYALGIAAAFVIFLLVKKYLKKKPVKDEKDGEGNSGGGGGGGSANIPNVTTITPTRSNRARNTRHPANATIRNPSTRFRSRT